MMKPPAQATKMPPASVATTSKSARRSSAHVLSDPDEIIAAHQNVTTTGHDLGVDMPAMASFADDIDRLASGR